MWYSDNHNFKTSLEFRIEAKTHLGLHEVQVSYSYSASYVIVTMSHNSTSLKQLLLFLEYFKWREYEAPSTTGVYRFVLMFKQAYCRPGLWLIDPIYFPFPRNHYRDLNETIRESSSSKMCIFLANLSINMAVLASDCLMYFRLLVWNYCMDFNKIL